MLHFTLIPFTAASGDPVMFLIIFSSEFDDLPLDWVLGIDMFRFDELMERIDESERQKLLHLVQSGDINTINEYVATQFGSDELFHTGPVCHFQGKDVPCLIAHTPKRRRHIGNPLRRSCEDGRT